MGGVEGLGKGHRGGTIVGGGIFHGGGVYYITRGVGEVGLWFG